MSNPVNKSKSYASFSSEDPIRISFTPHWTGVEGIYSNRSQTNETKDRRKSSGASVLFFTASLPPPPPPKKLSCHSISVRIRVFNIKHSILRLQCCWTRVNSKTRPSQKYSYCLCTQQVFVTSLCTSKTVLNMTIHTNRTRYFASCDKPPHFL